MQRKIKNIDPMTIIGTPFKEKHTAVIASPEVRESSVIASAFFESLYP